jgi:hypothetical protein
MHCIVVKRVACGQSVGFVGHFLFDNGVGFFLTTESGNPIRMYLCLPRTPLLTSIVMTSASTPIRATE